MDKIPYHCREICPVRNGGTHNCGYNSCFKYESIEACQKAHDYHTEEYERKCKTTLKTQMKGQYCDEETSADAERQEEREDRNIEINSNGVYLVGHICGACGGKMMIGGSMDNIQCWCSRCNRLAKNMDSYKSWGN